LISGVTMRMTFSWNSDPASASSSARGVKDDRERGLCVQGHLEELFAEQGQVDERLSERGAAPRVDHGFEDRTAHEGCRAHAIGEPGDVDHLGHLSEPAANVTHGIADGVVELVFAGGHGLRAQFFLEPADGVAVLRAVRQQPGDEEHAQAPGAVWSSCGPREREVDVGPDVGAEPLLAAETPFTVHLTGDALVRAHITAAGPLGEELCGLQQ
jgi:hypothetical protein